MSSGNEKKSVSSSDYRKNICSNKQLGQTECDLNLIKHFKTI